ncbi:Thymidylate kinase [Azotobacter beijerinckii]|uniref:Thymidylate kinase n=1 Tax=Azotobacter beijerinckii TaxID=170623 RepID=A0A1H9NWG6_9GAMM|nr:hypothetical protein [Azotobacter beijerinckii]SER39683.1 Thymidylate kinase [Azotobacter beijerinckii]
MNMMNTQVITAKPVQDDSGMAPLIAIVGCDGSGKTTLASGICSALQGYSSATYCYLGLGSRGIASQIESWPLIGRLLVRHLSAKAKQARTKGERIPGTLTALVIFCFSKLRVLRFNRMLRLRERGHVVICDRYPQLDVPGFYDGPGLSAARASGPLTAWLAKQERKLYERMVDYRPTLIIRLNIDAETAHARKPDHELPLLREKVAVTPLLRFNGAKIIEVNASQPLNDVHTMTLQIVQRVVADYQRSKLLAASPEAHELSVS